MNRHHHYEVAFEDYLRRRKISYVGVDETRRVEMAGNKIKSFDFLLYPSNHDRHWLVDVKGRKFPYSNSNSGSGQLATQLQPIQEQKSAQQGSPARRSRGRYWENWVTRADLDGLAEWQNIFGNDFEARFVFAYLLGGSPDHWPPGQPHAWQGQLYAFWSVPLADYVRHCRLRSTSWDTVSVPPKAFLDIAQPATGLC